ncbi:MAG: VWA domain-containing protein, partial [Oryzomonas sp.]
PVQVQDANTAIDAPYTYDTSSSLIWDSTYAAVDNTAARTNDQRIVILISDGEDYSITHTLPDLINHAIAQKIPVFTVTVLHPNHSYPALMLQLALQTGGQAFSASASDAVALQGIYLNISQILTSQYKIVYNTASTGGAPVTLNIKVNDNGNLGEFSEQVTGCQ